jgi:2-polyprenyl-3-methyl-5-hydroxy-6-metoxy-1,4-benzoquinol methylase
MVVSPLTGSADVTLVKALDCERLITAWGKIYQVDVRDQFHGHEKIFLYKCNETGLEFFLPIDVAGSAALYEKLEKYDWYYMPEKWEHDVAVIDLKGCSQVLEVGCGKGAFVERLCRQAEFDAQGIELNRRAVRSGKSKGIPVHHAKIEEFANANPSCFDAVCAFQVLEHVPNPYVFLQSLTNLLKPRGKLIISVPNAESFIKLAQDNLLDFPPHHMTRWSEKSFASLGKILPLRLARFRVEPLALYHIDWYLSLNLSRVPRIRPLPGIAARVGERLLKPILKNWPFARNRIVGHSLYVCFEKTP